MAKTIPSQMKSLAVNALRLAANAYDDAAADCAKNERLRLGFEMQSRQARALADAFELAGEVDIEYAVEDHDEICRILAEGMRAAPRGGS